MVLEASALAETLRRHRQQPPTTAAATAAGLTSAAAATPLRHSTSRRPAATLPRTTRHPPRAATCSSSSELSHRRRPEYRNHPRLCPAHTKRVMQRVTKRDVKSWKPLLSVGVFTHNARSSKSKQWRMLYFLRCAALLRALCGRDINMISQLTLCSVFQRDGGWRNSREPVQRECCTRREPGEQTHQTRRAQSEAIAATTAMRSNRWNISSGMTSVESIKSLNPDSLSATGFFTWVSCPDSTARKDLSSQRGSLKRMFNREKRFKIRSVCPMMFRLA